MDRNERSAKGKNICPVCGARMEEGTLQYIGCSPSAIRWFKITPSDEPGKEAHLDPIPEDINRTYAWFANVNWAALRCRNCKMFMAWY